MPFFSKGRKLFLNTAISCQYIIGYYAGQSSEFTVLLTPKLDQISTPKIPPLPNGVSQTEPASQPLLINQNWLWYGQPIMCLKVPKEPWWLHSTDKKLADSHLLHFPVCQCTQVQPGWETFVGTMQRKKIIGEALQWALPNNTTAWGKHVKHFSCIVNDLICTGPKLAKRTTWVEQDREDHASVGFNGLWLIHRAGIISICWEIQPQQWLFWQVYCQNWQKQANSLWVLSVWTWQEKPIYLMALYLSDLFWWLDNTTRGST